MRTTVQNELQAQRADLWDTQRERQEQGVRLMKRWRKKDRRFQAPHYPRRSIAQCEAYLLSRTGTYEQRSVRYARAIGALFSFGLSDESLVVDVGAGWTELDYMLRTGFNWRGRYWPLDCAIDGTDLNAWEPGRDVDFFVCLEILEHLRNPTRLLLSLMSRARRAIVCSVPNPSTTDVLGMDPTHVTKVGPDLFRALGFSVQEVSFYGRPADSLFAVWEVSDTVDINKLRP